jgi:hypothetical protein
MRAYVQLPDNRCLNCITTTTIIIIIIITKKSGKYMREFCALAAIVGMMPQTERESTVIIKKKP